jgi:hypothetical protein
MIGQFYVIPLYEKLNDKKRNLQIATIFSAMKNKKKRSDREMAKTYNPETSPKGERNSQFKSPRPKEKSPKRLRQDDRSTAAQEAVESPRKKQKGQFVGGSNSQIESINSLEITSPKPNVETAELSKSAQKKLKRMEGVKNSKVSESPKKVTNGNATYLVSGKNGAATDISNLFSEHDRLLPGAKRTSMAEEYGLSEPYVLHC